MNGQQNDVAGLVAELNNYNSDTSKVWLLIKMGNISSPDSALGYFEQAMLLAEKINFEDGFQEAKLALAYNQRILGNYESAIINLLELIKRQENEKDTLKLFEPYRLLRFCYSDLQDTSSIQYYTQKLIGLYESGFLQRTASTEKLATETYVYHNMKASSFEHMGGNIDSAMFHLRIIYEKAIEEDEQSWIGISAGRLADYASQDSSFFLMNESYSASLNAGRLDNAGRMLIKLSKAHFANADYDSSIFYSREALFLSSETQNNIITSQAYWQLYEVYNHLQEQDSAYAYLINWADINNTVLGLDKIYRIQAMNIKERIRSQEEAQAEIERQQRQTANAKLFSVLGVALLLLLLTGFYYRNNLLNKKKNQQLATAYSNLKSTQAQLIQSEKMASLGELTAGIAHEIQNPLNFVNNFSEVSAELMEELKGERLKVNSERNESVEEEIIGDVIQNLEKINHHGKRADAIVKGMLEHSRSGSGVKELTDVNTLANEYLNLTYQSFKSKNKEVHIELITDLDPTIPKIELVRPDIGKVLLNILNNAFYACAHSEFSPDSYRDHNSELKPQVKVSTKNIGDKIEISVSDNGPGIPDSIKDKIFQPFFTTKPTGQGTGLGLSLSYDIVKAHGGELKVETKEGEGSEFIIQLP
ncbi:ATP-binding protein [Aquiflexum sp. AIY15W]|nr:ATP-binding protein [Cognataquiflexum rubidum]